MTDAAQPADDSSNDEIERVTTLLADRLRTRGVLVLPSDTADELGTLTEAVEAFESAVEAQGGDLMVDEPPAGKRAQPDNAAFVLPVRTPDEPADEFIARIDEATTQLRA